MRFTRVFFILLCWNCMYEQLSNSNGLKFCMPLASAILADINDSICVLVPTSCSPIPLRLNLLHWHTPSLYAMSRANEKLISQHVTIFICKRAPARSYKVWTFDEIENSKTVGFFTILADSYGEPRTTLQSQSQQRLNFRVCNT